MVTSFCGFHLNWLHLVTVLLCTADGQLKFQELIIQSTRDVYVGSLAAYTTTVTLVRLCMLFSCRTTGK